MEINNRILQNFSASTHKLIASNVGSPDKVVTSYIFVPKLYSYVVINIFYHQIYWLPLKIWMFISFLTHFWFPFFDIVNMHFNIGAHFSNQLSIMWDVSVNESESKRHALPDIDIGLQKINDNLILSWIWKRELLVVAFRVQMMLILWVSH